LRCLYSVSLFSGRGGEGDEKGEVLLDLGLDEVQFMMYSFCFEIKPSIND
jgi:hypothetical protein